MIDRRQLNKAYRTVRRDLLAERTAAGHWVGELSTSALSTATAISALALLDREQAAEETGPFASPVRHDHTLLIDSGLLWLAKQQNPDGGFGDTDRSLSNIATTLLVDAAIRIAGREAQHTELLTGAREYIRSVGGMQGLRERYGKDKTFAVPILTNCALAGSARWKSVSSLPFELACLPQSMLGALQLPVVSYALPALIAIGIARFHHRPPLNPVLRMARAAAVQPALAKLIQIQPESGGFLEATPLTSFVVMSLVSTGRADHPVVKRGEKFLVDSVREDGSWPIDTNLATWNTTLAVNALSAGREVQEPEDHTAAYPPECLEWLLSCQHTKVHPYTGAQPGAWAWTDLSGGVPDADDTPGALLALSNWRNGRRPARETNPEVRHAAGWGVKWLLSLQNSDGGWPTFCRGWGALPFDRSGTDLTAHAIRAATAWLGQLAAPEEQAEAASREQFARFDARIMGAVERGFRYLAEQQRPDGSWIPLWFGNQQHPDEENPIYGTSKVLLAYRDLGRLAQPVAQHGLRWLAAHQNEDGGWGGGPMDLHNRQSSGPWRSSTEETALAVEALLSAAEDDAELASSANRGVAWLIAAVEQNSYRECSPIGFYFAKLWYYEKLYPLVFTLSALGHALSVASRGLSTGSPGKFPAAVALDAGPQTNQPAVSTRTS